MKINFWLCAFPALLSAFVVAGCSESVAPDTDNPADGIGRFEGQIDPRSGSVVMKTMEVEGAEGIPVRIQLIGRFVREAMPPETVGLAVSVRNIDTQSLYAPAELVLSKFRPANVWPHFDYADWVICPFTTEVNSTLASSDGCTFGFDYSALLGNDGALSPEETSGEKLMAFVNPDGVSFAFNVEARFGMQPNRPRIAGLYYTDVNGNGVPDPGEPSFGGGSVLVTGPGMNGRTVPVDGDGRFSTAVSEPGLYNLLASPPPTFAPVETTTSNPLEVVLLRGPDGLPQSFLHADFGWVNSPLVRPVAFLSGSSDSLKLDPYALLDIELNNRLLIMHIGFGGCQPDHPTQLYMVGGFMESFPVQAKLLLDHNDRGEVCDAWFEQRLAFSLQPIVDAYVKSYGQFDPIIIRFESADGAEHRFELRP